MQFESCVEFRNKRSLIRNTKGTACTRKVKFKLLFLISCAIPFSISSQVVQLHPPVDLEKRHLYNILVQFLFYFIYLLLIFETRN